jgi:arginase
MAEITLLTLAYDSGRPDERMGRGPTALLESGLPEWLRTGAHDVDVQTVRLPEMFYSEGQALVQLQRRTVPLVRESNSASRRVLILSGNCGPAALSAVCALNPQTIGVVWFDAHADFNTPETSASGFLDGMALAVLTGRCWPALSGLFVDFSPVPEANVILVGTRDLDLPETMALEKSAITRIAATKMAELADAFAALSHRIENLYVHVDVDVLDKSEGNANSYASAGGISAEDLYDALRLLESSGQVCAAGITSYDPATDDDGRIRGIIKKAATILSGER